MVKTSTKSNEETERETTVPDDYKQRLSPDEVQNVLAFLSRQSMRQDAPGDEGGPKGDH